MKKYKIYPKDLEQYEQALDLCWPISYWLAPEEQTCRVVCNQKSQVHEVWLSELAFQSPDLLTPDIVHELCHCAIAEQVDPVFSTIWFSEKWNQISRMEPERFGKLAQMLYLAWCHVDIWVNDLRHKHWPELMAQEYSAFAQGVVILLQRQELEVLSRPETLLSLAQHQAERERHGLTESPDLFAVLSAHGVEVEERIKGLADFFKSLPRLCFKSRKDLKILENSVVEVARRLEFPINPKLIWEKDKWVWALG